MAAMKPRTGDGPLEATKEGRGIVMRVPLEGGGRLVVELTPTRPPPWVMNSKASPAEFLAAGSRLPGRGYVDTVW